MPNCLQQEMIQFCCTCAISTAVTSRAPFESYLADLNQQELVNLIDRETKLDHYAGLKVGDIYAPNNNAGNWE